MCHSQSVSMGDADTSVDSMLLNLTWAYIVPKCLQPTRSYISNQQFIMTVLVRRSWQLLD